MIGVVLLVFMYLMTIITAITASDGAHNWFIGSIMLTVFVPVILYAINILINIQKRNEANNRMREEMYMRQIKDALKAKAEQEKAQPAAAQGQVQQEAQHSIWTALLWVHSTAMILWMEQMVISILE